MKTKQPGGSDDWFSFQDRKTAPKPSPQRPMPTFKKAEPVTVPARESGVEVEETDTTASAILRIFKKPWG